MIYWTVVVGLFLSVHYLVLKGERLWRDEDEDEDEEGKEGGERSFQFPVIYESYVQNDSVDILVMYCWGGVSLEVVS